MNRRSWTLIVEIYLVSVLASGLGRRARSMSQALLVWLCLLRDEGVRRVPGLVRARTCVMQTAVHARVRMRLT